MSTAPGDEKKPLMMGAGPLEEQRRQLAKVRADLLETRIGREIDLLGHRMNWLVASQAFLFGAWAATATGEGGARSITYAESARTPSASALAVVIPLVGYCIGLFALRACCAAKRMIVFFTAELQPETHGALGLRSTVERDSAAWTISFGNVPSLFLPPLFMGVWLAIWLCDRGTAIGWLAADVGILGGLLAAALAGALVHIPGLGRTGHPAWALARVGLAARKSVLRSVSRCLRSRASRSPFGGSKPVSHVPPSETNKFVGCAWGRR